MIAYKYYDTLVWIPTSGKYKKFSKILDSYKNLNLRNFIYVIVYEKFQPEIYLKINSKDFENFIYLNKNKITDYSNIDFNNINTICDYLKKKKKINIKYFLIASDDDYLINRTTFLKQMKILKNNHDVSFVIAPGLMKLENQKTLFFNLSNITLNGEKFLDLFNSTFSLPHITINSIFRLKFCLESSAFKKDNLFFEGFGADYRLFFSLAFLPNTKIKIINSQFSRIIFNRSQSMTGRYPFLFAHNYFIATRNIANDLIKKYSLSKTLFSALLKIRYNEMIRCYNAQKLKCLNSPLHKNFDNNLPLVPYYNFYNFLFKEVLYNFKLLNLLDFSYIFFLSLKNLYYDKKSIFLKFIKLVNTPHLLFSLKAFLKAKVRL
jgi:hypothetical protein